MVDGALDRRLIRWMTSPIGSENAAVRPIWRAAGRQRRTKFDHEPENACSTVRSFV
jgi:hypothetical protein